ALARGPPGRLSLARPSRHRDRARGGARPLRRARHGPTRFRLPRLLLRARFVEWIPREPGDPRGPARLAAALSRSRFASLRRRAATDGGCESPLGVGEGPARGAARSI